MRRDWVCGESENREQTNEDIRFHHEHLSLNFIFNSTEILLGNIGRVHWTNCQIIPITHGLMRKSTLTTIYYKEIFESASFMYL